MCRRGLWLGWLRFLLGTGGLWPLRLGGSNGGISSRQRRFVSYWCKGLCTVRWLHCWCCRLLHRRGLWRWFRFELRCLGLRRHSCGGSQAHAASTAGAHQGGQSGGELGG